MVWFVGSDKKARVDDFFLLIEEYLKTGICSSCTSSGMFVVFCDLISVCYII